MEKLNTVKTKLKGYMDALRSYASAKDENGRRKNALVLYTGAAAAVLVLLFVLVLCLVSAKDDSKGTRLELNPQDSTATSDEVLFEDNQAIAVDDSEEEPEIIENSADDEIGAFANAAVPLADEDTANAQAPSPDTAALAFNLYCDSYAKKAQATEHKATIAFSTGLISDVTLENGTYSLHLGPYKTRDEAVEVFNKLDSLGLVGECKMVSGK